MSRPILIIAGLIACIILDFVCLEDHNITLNNTDIIASEPFKEYHSIVYSSSTLQYNSEYSVYTGGIQQVRLVMDYTIPAPLPPVYSKPDLQLLV